VTPSLDGYLRGAEAPAPCNGAPLDFKVDKTNEAPDANPAP
jgi:hypothetical protein